MSAAFRLPRKPEARAEKVEDLVDRMLRGTLRVPQFQRGLNWGENHVALLFDSLFRGYPVGSLLFYRGPAHAARVSVGPLLIDAAEERDCWWVIDGQQRLTTLAACLGRSPSLPEKPERSDPYVLYFVADEQKFRAPGQSQEIPSTWVPVPVLLDATGLSEWVHGWKHREDESLRRAAFEAGSRIRDYQVPLYLLETRDDGTAQEIYYRTNNSGKPLDWPDVHKALFGATEDSPSTLPELAESLSEVGMGRLEEGRLLTCLQAMRGLDPTRVLSTHLEKNREVLKGAVAEAMPILRKVLSFLRGSAGIPHLALLPSSSLLDVLTRFFALHPDPKPRSKTLLVRWYWRVLLGASKVDERTLRRRGIVAISPNEEQSLQDLLELVRKERPSSLELSTRFDARADESRIALLALAHLRPRDLRTGETLDIAGLLESEGMDCFRRVVSRSDVPGAGTAANRLVQARAVDVRRLIREEISRSWLDNSLLPSHAIGPEAASRLAQGDEEGFLAARKATIQDAMNQLAERRAEWDYPDRPSVSYILESSRAEP